MQIEEVNMRTQGTAGTDTSNTGIICSSLSLSLHAHSDSIY